MAALAPVSLSFHLAVRTKQIAPFPESVPHYKISSPPSPHTSLPFPPRSLNTWTISPPFPVSTVFFLNVCPHRFGSRPRLPAWLLSEVADCCRACKRGCPELSPQRNVWAVHHHDPGAGPHRQESWERAPAGACPSARLRSE